MAARLGRAGGVALAMVSRGVWTKMAKKPPQKGSHDWHPIPDAPPGYEDVKIGIKYVGAHEARSWAIEMQRAAMEETKRGVDGYNLPTLIAGYRDTLSRIVRGEGDPSTLAQERLDSNAQTTSVEFINSLGEMTDRVLVACVVGARGVEGLSEDDASGALDLLEYLGDSVESAVFRLVQEVQSLTTRQKFCAESAGDV